MFNESQPSRERFLESKTGLAIATWIATVASVLSALVACATLIIQSSAGWQDTIGPSFLLVLAVGNGIAAAVFSSKYRKTHKLLEKQHSDVLANLMRRCDTAFSVLKPDKLAYIKHCVVLTFCDDPAQLAEDLDELFGQLTNHHGARQEGEPAPFFPSWLHCVVMSAFDKWPHTPLAFFAKGTPREDETRKAALERLAECYGALVASDYLDVQRVGLAAQHCTGWIKDWQSNERLHLARECVRRLLGPLLHQYSGIYGKRSGLESVGQGLHEVLQGQSRERKEADSRLIKLRKEYVLQMERINQGRATQSDRSDAFLAVCYAALYGVASAFESQIATVVGMFKSTLPDKRYWVVQRGEPAGRLLDVWKDAAQQFGNRVRGSERAARYATPMLSFLDPIKASDPRLEDLWQFMKGLL